MNPPAAGPFSLSEDQIERYARQIIVPGIGAEGQSKLCSSVVFVEGHPDGIRVAKQYLRAAGVRVPDATNPGHRVDCVVIAGTSEIPAERFELLIRSAPIVAWYELTERGLRGGLTAAMRPSIERSRAPGGHLPLAHRLGGADAAATTVAALLGWIVPGELYEIDLI